MNIHYKEEGTGQPLVLFHGFCNNHTIWNTFRGELARDFRVITPDLPGHGESPMPARKVTFPRVADTMAEWLRSIGVERDAILIGHSMGGYVALSLLDQYPELVKGLGLFHSNAFPDSPTRFAGRTRSMEVVKQFGMGAFVESFIPFLFYSERVEELSGEIKLATEMALNTAAETHLAFTKAMRDRQDRSELLTNELPKLLIIGEEDSAVSMDLSLKMVEKANHATVHRLAQTGHMGMYERPTETLAMVREFALSLQ